MSCVALGLPALALPAQRVRSARRSAVQVWFLFPAGWPGRCSRATAARCGWRQRWRCGAGLRHRGCAGRTAEAPGISCTSLIPDAGAEGCRPRYHHLPRRQVRQRRGGEGGRAPLRRRVAGRLCARVRRAGEPPPPLHSARAPPARRVWDARGCSESAARGRVAENCKARAQARRSRAGPPGAGPGCG